MWNNGFLIGTAEYLTDLQQRKLDPHDQLDLILNGQLQAYVDSNGFLQLPPSEYSFSPMLHPLSDFYVYFRDLVVAAYHTPAGLRADELGRKIHLFRSYLDRQNIDFIRHYQCSGVNNSTDFQRLIRYASDSHIKLDLKTSAGFHNRYHGKHTYPKNMKAQLIRNSYALTRNRARMIEFIVDIDSGNFISQWNVLQQNGDGVIDADPQRYSADQLYQIANTESFNYGIPYGGRPVFGKYHNTHQWLDITQPQNSMIRKNAKNYWRYPHDYNRGGEYADLVKNYYDILAWRNIPQHLRQQVYDDFVRWLQDCHKNRGINHFLKHSEYRMFYCKNI